MNTKFVSMNENLNEMQAFNVISSSTPKPTISPPPVDNLYFQAQAAKYSFHSPAANCYYTNSTPLVSPMSYYANNNNGYVDTNYQYHYQLDSGYNSYCPTNSSTSSQLIDSNYYSKHLSPYESGKSMYYSDSAYESPVLASPLQKVNKLFTIDSILNDNMNKRNDKENIVPTEVSIDKVNNEDNNGKTNNKRTGRASSKRVRTIFTQEQLEKLEIEFMKQQYMVGSERYYLANELNLNEAQVKIWFQNRRIKWRRDNIDQKRSLNQNDLAAHSPFSNTNDSISNEH